MKRILLATAAGVAALAAVAPAFAQQYGQPYGQQQYGQQPYGQQPAPAYGGGMNQPAPGYGDHGYGDRDRGYGDHDRDRERGDGDRGYGQGGGGDFWRGAPTSAWERVQWLQQRIERGRADGSLNPREAFRAQRELDKTKAYARNMRRRYGDLRPEDREYIQQRLDYVSKTIRWARHNDR